MFYKRWVWVRGDAARKRAALRGNRFGQTGMRRKSRGPQKIGDVLANVMARRGYGNQQSSEELEATWQRAAGQKLADVSRPGSLRRGTLEIVVKNSLALQELAFQQKRILRDLNTIYPPEKIKELRFRVGNID